MTPPIPERHVKEMAEIFRRPHVKEELVRHEPVTIFKTLNIDIEKGAKMHSQVSAIFIIRMCTQRCSDLQLFTISQNRQGNCIAWVLAPNGINQRV